MFHCRVESWSKPRIREREGANSWKVLDVRSEEKKSYERREKDFSRRPFSPPPAYCFRLTSSYSSIELLGNSRGRETWRSRRSRDESIRWRRIIEKEDRLADIPALFAVFRKGWREKHRLERIDLTK